MHANIFISESQFASLLDALVQAATTLINLPELIDRDALAMALAAGGVCPASIRQDLERERHQIRQADRARRAEEMQKVRDEMLDRMRTTLDASRRRQRPDDEKPRVRVRARSRLIG